jgi:hypothetical protein
MKCDLCVGFYRRRTSMMIVVATPDTFSLTQSGNNLMLNFTAVPEPSIDPLLGLSLAMAAASAGASGA